MANDISKIKKNSIYNILRTAFKIIYPLVTLPYIMRVLEAENVGKIDFSGSIVSYVSLVATLGVAAYAVRECSQHRENAEDLGQTASEILSINIVSTIIAYIGLVVVLLFSRELDSYRLLIGIQALTIAFDIIGADWLNSAMEDFRYITIRTIIVQIISLIAMFIFVRTKDDYVIYAIILTVATSGASLINVFYRRKYCKTRFTLKLNLKKHLIPILLLFSLQISQSIFVNSDKTILGLIKGDYQVGLYGVSVRIYTMANTMLAAFTTVMIPRLSEGFAKKDYGDINHLMKYALELLLVLGIPCVCFIEAIAPEIITAIAGESYVDASLSLQLLGGALLFSMIGGWVLNLSLIPAGRDKEGLISSIICAVVNIGLNFVLIPLWGLNAAALTTLLAQLIGMVLMFFYMDKKIKIDGLSNILKGPLIGGLCFVLLGLLFRTVFNNVWIVVGATAVAGLASYAVVLTVFHNQLFLDFAGSFIRRIRKK